MYLLTLLFTLVTLSIGAEEANISIKKSTAVPHNNGTDGLLKNTLMEPIDNFKRLKIKSSTNPVKTAQPVTEVNQAITVTESALVNIDKTNISSNGQSKIKDGEQVKKTNDTETATLIKDQSKTPKNDASQTLIKTVPVTTSTPVATLENDIKILDNTSEIPTTATSESIDKPQTNDNELTESSIKIESATVVEKKTKQLSELSNQTKSAIHDENHAQKSDTQLIKPAINSEPALLIKSKTENASESFTSPAINSNPTSIKKDKLNNNKSELIESSIDPEQATMDANKPSVSTEIINDVKKDMVLPVTDINDQ
jgi:hypothetical protein